MNDFELEVKEKLEKSGFIVYRNGWPDFLVEDMQGTLFCIEVKSHNDIVRPNQKILLSKLAGIGLPVFIVTDDIKSIEKHTDRFKQLAKKIKTNNYLALDKALGKIEKELIHLALKETSGNKGKAATILGISERSLRYRLDRKV